MQRWLLGVALSMAVILLIPCSVFAEVKPSNKGLLITPPRQYLEATPGKTTKSSLAIANLTDNPVNVSLSYKQFSVADYTYDYKFEMPKENWISFETTQVMLKKTESRTIAYTIAVPKNASPGGHYFTLFASMSLGDGKLVRAATVVYVTVSGELTKQSTVIKNSLPLISFGGEIPYELQVRNTGNTHFLIYKSARLYGLTAKGPTSEVAHLLIPNTTRTIKGSIPPPLIGGIYQAEYGFRDEDGRATKYQRYILFAPPQSWILLTGVIWLVFVLVKRHKRLKNQSTGS